jgi:YHS domain-containing protein
MPEDKTPPTPARKPVRATICHRIMTVDSVWYPQAEYQGRTIYFCTEFCLEAFRADPERFYIAHSRRKDIRK